MNKYRLEKVLHELIRDLPKVLAINTEFERGFITKEEAFKSVSDAIKNELERAK